MITTRRYPSYGNWLDQGATSLWESVRPRDCSPDSHNHHFWGDVSGWMFEALAGIQVNPHEREPGEVLLLPRIIDALEHVSAFHTLPQGRLSSAWKRVGDQVEWTVEIPEGCYGMLQLEAAWQFDDGTRFKPAASGVYRLLPAGAKDRYYQPEKDI